METVNLKELRKNKTLRLVSMKKALECITKFNWTDEVLAGKRKVEVK